MRKMKEKKVHGFKHYLMLVLVSIANLVYHSDLSAYVCQPSSSPPSGYIICIKASSTNICDPDLICHPSMYLCLDSSDLAYIGPVSSYCSAQFTNTTGTRCYSVISRRYFDTCRCRAGAYGATSSTCSLCPGPGTSAEGTAVITGCYIASTVITTDSNGHKWDCNGNKQWYTN